MATTYHEPTALPEEPPPETRPAGEFDSWYSALASFVFHFCLVMIVSLLAGVLEQQDRLPVAVETVQVAATSATTGEADDELPAGDVAESLDSADFSEMPLPEAPSEEVASVEPVEINEIVPDQAEQEAVLQDQLAGAQRASSAARNAARQKLNQNLGGSAGSESGGGGGSGRAGRAARWVLNFNAQTADGYLEQLGALGAEVAFPQRGDNYLYFTDLAGSRASASRNLSNENRIFWIDDVSFRGVARALGVQSAPFMCAFLPHALEERMLKLELAYRNAPNEDAILQTVFEAVRRGSGYDVIVVDQQLK